MKIALITIYLCLWVISVFAQQPTFKWGPPVNHSPRQLQQMQVIGAAANGFYALYEEDSQVTLEYYDAENRRIWATALYPRSPAGQVTKFHSVQLIRDQLYMISSGPAKGQTAVYAQGITAQGNYEPEIVQLASGRYGKTVHVATASNEAALVVVLSGDNRQTITSALLSGQLRSRWTQTLVSSGDMQEARVLPDGTTFILTKSLAAAPPSSAFFLYRLQAQDGHYEETSIGHGNFRPLHAKLTVTPAHDVIVAGFAAPGSSVASLHPEPVGTFYYRFKKGGLQNPVVTYTPFDKKFIDVYKSSKPDEDRSQRLRNLHLEHVLPTGNASVILLGEVKYKDNSSPQLPLHNDDILAVRLDRGGSPLYTISVNKHQSSPNDGTDIGSYFATTLTDTLQLLYLDFEYDYTARNQMSMANPGSISKIPVLVTVLPNGAQRALPLRNTQTGNHQKLYLRPASAYPVSGREFIVLGIGPGYYKYGKMKF
ncbi:MAG: hypothetical protein LPK14_12050 [Hymenobacteraceae bacterium]|nr:hypothetical protein [Hymenobacteraceae bacterium]